jgi:defect-in-organelle-trafficking protein DotC
MTTGFRTFILIILVMSLAGCARKPPVDKCVKSLGSLQKLSFNNTNPAISAMRLQMLRDTALSVGARGGLAFRASQINCVLIRQEKLLFKVFNFRAMMLDKNVLPPVLLEGRNLLTLGGSDLIRVADRNYQILMQAKFVTAPPTWREYLWMNYCTPDVPDKTLLPRNYAERMVWKRFIKDGWLAGIAQGDSIFKENLGRLKRDYEGMIRYRTLLAQRMVSPPFVAQLDMGITGGCNDMTINDRVLRITAFPCLQTDGKTWKTEIIPYEHAIPACCP